MSMRLVPNDKRLISMTMCCNTDVLPGKAGSPCLTDQLLIDPVCRVKQSHVWGWLEPSCNSDLMPVTYLKGAGAAIGRGAEAFEAQQGQHAESTSSLEAAMQTSRSTAVPLLASITFQHAYLPCVTLYLADNLCWLAVT